jgi:hypothetical protein
LISAPSVASADAVIESFTGDMNGQLKTATSDRMFSDPVSSCALPFLYSAATFGCREAETGDQSRPETAFRPSGAQQDSIFV